MTSKKITFSIASIFFTFFVDNLCWSIVFPLFAPYFLDVNNTLFSQELEESTRTLILGFFLMAFSLGQFIGAPLLGEYADRKGRKQALILSVLFTFGALALSAWGMGTGVLWLLFIGRLITGLFAGNMSICLAAVADLSPTEKAKVKNFGYLSVLAGLSFILGAFLGGKLSDPTLCSLFSPAFPLWAATALTAFNLLFLYCGFQETHPIDETVQFNLLESFRNIKQALHTEKIKKIYAVYFLFLFAWTILFQFTPVLVVQNFQFNSSDIGDLALYMGLCWALGSTYLSKILLHRFSSLRVLEGCLCSFTGLLMIVLFTEHKITTLVVIGGCVMIGGLAWPLCTNLISSLAPKNMQGKILGISQSVQSLSMAIAPVAGGLVASGAIRAPFIVAIVSGFLAILVYFNLRDCETIK